MKKAKKLWHAKSGTVFVQYFLGIEDKEVLDAIRYHTTARAGMTQLDKILYLADFTSADRDYDDVDILRGIAEKSMEDAIRYALAYSITDLVQQGRAIHPDTVAAYNEINL